MITSIEEVLSSYLFVSLANTEYLIYRDQTQAPEYNLNDARTCIYTHDCIHVLYSPMAATRAGYCFPCTHTLPNAGLQSMMGDDTSCRNRGN